MHLKLCHRIFLNNLISTVKKKTVGVKYLYFIDLIKFILYSVLS